MEISTLVLAQDDPERTIATDAEGRSLGSNDTGVEQQSGKGYFIVGGIFQRSERMTSIELPGKFAVLHVLKSRWVLCTLGSNPPFPAKFSHPMHTAVLRPASERLSVEVKDDGTQTPQQNQGRICHDGRDEAVGNNPVLTHY